MNRAPSHQAIVEVLAATSTFGGLAPDILDRLAEACTTRTFGRGQYLWYQGDEGDRLMVVASGRLKVVLNSEQGDEVVLATVGQHEVIGELAVLDGSPRSASVVAARTTTVVMLTRPTVLGLMAREPAVLDAVLRTLGQLVRRLTEQTGDLIFLDLGGRLAKLLLRMGASQADGSGPVVLDLGLSQSDLAAMVGASRPAVNKVLQRLASRGMISVDGQVIVLRDLAALRRRAGG